MDWKGLADRYGDRIFLVARSILGDDALARDVAQETLLKLRKADGVHDYDAWVLRVAGNAARDALRSRSRRREVAIEPDVVDARRPVREEPVENVTRAIEALPSGPRDILLLKFREGLSGPEIASALGCSLEAAWQRLSRAMRLLKSKLTEEP